MFGINAPVNIMLSNRSSTPAINFIIAVILEGCINTPVNLDIVL